MLNCTQKNLKNIHCEPLICVSTLFNLLLIHMHINKIKKKNQNRKRDLKTLPSILGKEEPRWKSNTYLFLISDKKLLPSLNNFNCSRRLQRDSNFWCLERKRERRRTTERCDDELKVSEELIRRRRCWWRNLMASSLERKKNPSRRHVSDTFCFLFNFLIIVFGN